jgi:MFS family permease
VTSPAGHQAGGCPPGIPDGNRTLVAAPVITQTVGYGALYYAFAVFLVPLAADLHTFTTATTGAFTVSVLTSAVLAVPVGRWLDRHGGRALMTVLLAGWSQVHTRTQLYLVQIGVLSVTGRLVTTGLRRRYWMTTSVAAIFAVQAAAAAALPVLGGNTVAAIIAVTGFGLGFGVATIAEPALLTDRYDTRRYAAIACLIVVPSTAPLAAAPLAAAWLHGAAHGCGSVFTATAVTCLVAAAALIATPATSTPHDLADTAGCAASSAEAPAQRRHLPLSPAQRQLMKTPIPQMLAIGRHSEQRNVMRRQHVEVDASEGPRGHAGPNQRRAVGQEASPGELMTRNIRSTAQPDHVTRGPSGKYGR